MSYVLFYRNSSSVDQTTDSILSNIDDLDSTQACRPLYQSANVDVYARFVTADSAHGSPPYMLHRKAVFRLTDLVRDRIQLSNATVARLRSGKSVIDGLRPGRSEIQVTHSEVYCDKGCLVVAGYESTLHQMMK